MILMMFSVGLMLIVRLILMNNKIVYLGEDVHKELSIVKAELGLNSMNDAVLLLLRRFRE